jgi:hypothetical protein
MSSLDLPQRNETPKSIFNPLKTDFVTEIRDDDNQNRKYFIRSMEIDTFPAYIARHIANHLITAVQNERGINSTNEKAIEEIRKEIEVSGL